MESNNYIYALLGLMFFNSMSLLFFCIATTREYKQIIVKLELLRDMELQRLRELAYSNEVERKQLELLATLSPENKAKLDAMANREKHDYDRNA